MVGYNENSRKLYDILHKDLAFGYKIEGFFDDILSSDSHLEMKYLGKLSDIEKYIKQEKVNEMYVSLHYTDSFFINSLIKLSEKYLVRIKFVPDFYEYTKARKININFYENMPVLMFRKEPLEKPLNRLIKTGFDFLFSLIVIVFVFSWLFPVLIILVRLSSPGPIFFKQLRTGEDNREFTCLKFRTMKVNSLSDELQATAKDPRITTIGSIMRKTNLDELPQFFNVLWGNMSVVGPRPHMLKHTEEYSELIDNYLVRHFVKPGITGWAQVNGYRGETQELNAMKKRVEYDIWYIENWNLLLDLKIIFLTVYNMIKGEKNAY
jgi:undecaprenyl-phosphate galactose phosphotransferase/putative colanic acid biosynthesis UDP-glucose lipid carrier transferase